MNTLASQNADLLFRKQRELEDARAAELRAWERVLKLQGKTLRLLREFKELQKGLRK